MNVEVLLDKLLKAVSFKFAEDATRPGVVTAVLKNGNYYASVVRYGSAFTNGKQVVCKAQSGSLALTLEELARSFLDLSRQPTDPIQELNSFVSSSDDVDQFDLDHLRDLGRLS